MTAAGALTEQDVVTVREEVATGSSVTVWFTAAAVGVPVGGSARVVSVGDVAEGDFIQVRPAGSRDTMFCSPNELTRARPKRRRAAEPPASKPIEKPATNAAEPRAKPPAEAPVVPKAVAPQEAASEGEVRPTPAAARRQPARPIEVSVSLTSTADGDWSVEVLVGKKRVVRSTPVQAADVATAARSLPPAVAEAIESSLEGARQRQRERIERLRAELDAAQRVLDQLDA